MVTGIMVPEAQIISVESKMLLILILADIAVSKFLANRAA
jgi:hypothetical protein